MTFLKLRNISPTIFFFFFNFMCRPLFSFPAHTFFFSPITIDQWLCSPSPLLLSDNANITRGRIKRVLKKWSENLWATSSQAQ